MTANSATLTAGKDIGKLTDPTAPIPLTVTVNNLTANATGTTAVLKVLGTGALNVPELTFRGRVILDASGRSLILADPVGARSVELTVWDIANPFIQSYTTFTLNTLNPAFVLNGEANSVRTLTMFSAGGVGELLNPFRLSSVGAINVTTSSNMLYTLHCPLVNHLELIDLGHLTKHVHCQTLIDQSFVSSFCWSNQCPIGVILHSSLG